MVDQFSWLHDDEMLLLFGRLNQKSLNPLWNLRYEVMQGIRQINLCGLTHIDTAGIALLIHLVYLSKTQKTNITLIGVNDTIHTLAELYNLPVEVLPL